MPRPWSWACSRPSPSRWSNSAFRSKACARRSTSSAAWRCCARPRTGGALTEANAGSMKLGNESDIVMSRQLVRRLTQQLKFSLVDQTKMITAASELSRNTVVYGGGGEMRWQLVENGTRSGLRLTFEDHGPG